MHFCSSETEPQTYKKNTQRPRLDWAKHARTPAQLLTHCEAADGGFRRKEPVTVLVLHDYSLEL